ncbi:MAG: radical SAM protein [Candidatus Omnitrophica bacterium]|nr:radical SAM protein [Candidatus Omnitrophota bacterium]
MGRKFIKKLFCIFTLAAFLATSGPLPQVLAQTISELPAPGSMVLPGTNFAPVMIKGLTVDPLDPFGFDFLLDSGNAPTDAQTLKTESQKLIRFFLAALTIPESDVWVNLSPYEQDRIISDNLSQTEMGRDLLSQDYLLKQLTASMLDPQKSLGAEFWARVYQKVHEKYGDVELPVNTFHKVWIVADSVDIDENEGGIVLLRSHLKVMTDQDYLAREKNTRQETGDAQEMSRVNDISTGIVRDIIIPEVEKEVNEGATFARLRQIYHAIILAAWYKENLKQTLLASSYVDHSLVRGIELDDKATSRKIYDRYVEAFKKGVIDLIKEDASSGAGEAMPRHYFSGGINIHPRPILQQARERLKRAPVDRSQVEFAMNGAPYHVEWRALPVEDSQLSSRASELARQAFKLPQAIRDMVVKDVRVKPLNNYTGKSMTCLWLTRFCPVGCKHCFFASPKPRRPTEDDAFTPEGMTKLVKFLNDANTGYLLVSGGGDPFIEFDGVRRILEEVHSDTVCLVTSAYWAMGQKHMDQTLDRLLAAIEHRRSTMKNPGKIILRVSIDKEHAEQINRGSLSKGPYINLIKAFQARGISPDVLELQIHTLFGDTTVDDLLSNFKVVSREVSETRDVDQVIATTVPDEDKDKPIKISGKKVKVELEGGLKLTVGYAKHFHSDTKVDLSDPVVVARNSEVFDLDMQKNHRDNPGVVYSSGGSLGLNFGISYDGKVRIWATESPDRLYNINRHEHQEIVDGTFEDIISLAVIEKGLSYRDSIVAEVNPRAVIRTKAKNIRDFIGEYINEEARTRMYLSVRVMQDYMTEGRITDEMVASWPEELRTLVAMTREQLMEFYNTSEHSIIDDYFSSPDWNVDSLVRLYELTIKGHYDVKPERLKEFIRNTDRLSRLQKAEFLLKTVRLSLGLLIQTKAFELSSLGKALQQMDRSFTAVLAEHFERADPILSQYMVALRTMALAFAHNDLPSLGSRISFAAQGQHALPGSPANFFAIMAEEGNRDRPVVINELVTRAEISSGSVEADMRVLRAAGLVERELVGGVPVFRLSPFLRTNEGLLGRLQEKLNEVFQENQIVQNVFGIEHRARIVNALLLEIERDPAASLQIDTAVLREANREAVIRSRAFRSSANRELAVRKDREEAVGVLISQVQQIADQCVDRQELLLRVLSRNLRMGEDVRTMARSAVHSIVEVHGHGAQEPIRVAFVQMPEVKTVYATRQLLKLYGIQAEFVVFDRDQKQLSKMKRLDPHQQVALIGSDGSIQAPQGSFDVVLASEQGNDVYPQVSPARQVAAAIRNPSSRLVVYAPGAVEVLDTVAGVNLNTGKMPLLSADPVNGGIDLDLKYLRRNTRGHYEVRVPSHLSPRFGGRWIGVSPVIMSIAPVSEPGIFLEKAMGYSRN